MILVLSSTNDAIGKAKQEVGGEMMMMVAKGADLANITE
jgi:hypothetical protein